jgi:RNA polymerase sigma-70 factor (ECF subfamily)
MGRPIPSAARDPPSVRHYPQVVTLDATTLLLEWRSGSRAALDALFPLVYADLRRRAHHYLGGEREGHTLSTTALVHETYIKLLDIDRIEIQDRAHFLALAATAMRRVLVEYARRHNAAKRGGGHATESILPDSPALPDLVALSAARAEQMLELDDAIARLSAQDERLGRVIELRFFGGLTVEETAQALDLAPSTVKLDWQKAKAWLYRDLAGE